MALANPKLIQAIEKTAAKLASGINYQWGHMGECNCGILSQELTHFTKADIHRFAMQKAGDWNEQLLDYCPSSGLPMDMLISKMLEFGLTVDDLAHLERLSDPEILIQFPKEKRDRLNKNSRDDVVDYLETWANVLKNKRIEEQRLKIDFTPEKKLKLPVLV